MKRFATVILAIVALLCVMPASAKKYKWTYGDHVCEVYTTGQGKNHTQLVKAWAVAKSADKAIEQAKMDAVTAALFSGIGFDEKTHGMGVSNLRPLVTGDQYREHEGLFQEFFKQGTFLQYVKEVNSAYPSGENNMACPGGRRVGINLVVDYPALRHWLEENGVIKGLGGHFRN
ncbi:MAG: hypothetical protein K2M56_09025 [Muribaculaceae bacterium]|nr:hypothetical protein [Muribaculaceae bacterium]